MGEINSELILLIVNFLPGLVASRRRFVRTELGEQLIVLFTTFCIYCVNCQHSVRYYVITFSVTSSICCQEFQFPINFLPNPIKFRNCQLSWVTWISRMREQINLQLILILYLIFEFNLYLSE